MVIKENKKKLILPVKSEWFQMEKEGIKPEDYREIKPYWQVKFCKNYFKGAEFCIQGECPICKLFDPIEYNEVELTEGYPKREDKERRLIKKFKRVWISWGRPEWGAPEKRCFIIQWKKN